MCHYDSQWPWSRARTPCSVHSVQLHCIGFRVSHVVCVGVGSVAVPSLKNFRKGVHGEGPPMFVHDLCTE